MQFKNRMRVQIYKSGDDGKFYLIPAPAHAGILNNRECESGYIYELDLNTGELWMHDWFELPTEKIWDKYSLVGWAEIDRVESWHIAPLALDKKKLEELEDCCLTKDFAKDDDD